MWGVVYEKNDFGNVKHTQTHSVRPSASVCQLGLFYRVCLCEFIESAYCKCEVQMFLRRSADIYRPICFYNYSKMFVCVCVCFWGVNCVWTLSQNQRRERVCVSCRVGPHVKWLVCVGVWLKDFCHDSMFSVILLLYALCFLGPVVQYDSRLTHAGLKSEWKLQ